jgi:transposase
MAEHRRLAEKALLPPKIKTPKRKTNGRIGLLIKKIVEKNPKIPYRDIPAALKDCGVDQEKIPSATTCQTFLKENSMQVVRLLKKPLIHERNQLKRVIFAEERKEKSPEFWRRIIWSDETTVRSIPTSKIVTSWVHSGTKVEDRPINPQVHSGGFSVMFWGCFSWYGLGPLVALEGNMNALSYIELLREHLIPEVAAAGIPMVFMQDNAPCHTARIVKDFMAERGLETMPWPPQSPDMNPIENLWAIIKQRRKKKYGVPTSKTSLIDQIFDIWDNVTIELCQKLADSTIKRLNMCIERKGKATKY